MRAPLDELREQFVRHDGDGQGGRGPLHGLGDGAVGEADHVLSVHLEDLLLDEEAVARRRRALQKSRFKKIDRIYRGFESDFAAKNRQNCQKF